jgi:hypothetical protein
MGVVGLCAYKPEAQIRAICNENYMVAGLEVLLACIGGGQAQIDTFVDLAENTMCNNLFHA